MELTISSNLKDHIFRAITVPDNRNDCWIWKGFTGIEQKIFEELTRSQYRVPLKVYEIIHDVELPSYEKPFRLCDNPKCVNPDHIVRYYSDNHFWLLSNPCDTDECWEWSGDKTGRLGNQPTYNIHTHKRRSAARVAIQLMFDIDVTTQIKRSCKNPNCVNPWHMVFKHS